MVTGMKILATTRSLTLVVFPVSEADDTAEEMPATDRTDAAGPGASIPIGPRDPATMMTMPAPAHRLLKSA